MALIDVIRTPLILLLQALVSYLEQNEPSPTLTFGPDPESNQPPCQWCNNRAIFCPCGNNHCRSHTTRTCRN